MILRCRFPKASSNEPCDGIVGAAPNGSLAIRVLRRHDEVSDGCYTMKCDRCKRIWEVAPPILLAA